MSSGQVLIEVVDGSCSGRRFEFEEQDTFMIGRADDCNCVITGDGTFSRHHLFIEINQANVTLKDLGSLNGTTINGRRIYQGRGQDVDPEMAEPSQPVGLHDGDKIGAGNNTLLLRILSPAVCVDCASEIQAQDKKACEFVNGSYLCQACRKREHEKNKLGNQHEDKKPADVRMNLQQRESAERNPGGVVDELLREFLNLRGAQGGLPDVQGYSDLTKIGEGGFGAVYKAKRISDGKIVAIKTMLQTRRPDRNKLLLFEREKEIIVQLRHPNIVRCESTGVWNDIHFIEMDYANGGSLWDLMEGGKRSINLDVAAPWILQMIDGLAYAHEVELTVSTSEGPKKRIGVIHRDLKPPNVLLTRENGHLIAQLSDFGLAKAFGAAGCTQGALSQTGTTCGSPPYMAPEHLTNYKYVKPATDVFEMAATIFHILTGQTIRSIGHGRDPFKCVLEEPLRRLKDHLRGCPKELGEVMDCALALNARDRYPDGREFLLAMKKAL